MAVTIVRDDIIDDIGAYDPSDLPRLDRMLAVATEVVLSYAPNAPDIMHNEAAIRFIGYLGQADYGTIRSESAGERSVEYHLNHSTAFRNCGAEMLLTRYKKRRAG